MRKCVGITEPYWQTLTETERLFWKLFCRGVTLFGGYLVFKSGNIYIDAGLVMLTAAFLFIFIEPQRSYSKLHPRVRKASVRLAIFLARFGVLLLGLAFLTHVFLGSMARVYVDDIAPNLANSEHVFSQYIMLGSFFVATLLAPILLSYQLQFKRLIFDLPRDGMKNLLMHKRWKATDFLSFVHIEYGALAGCLLYMCMLSELARIFIAVF